MKLKLLIGLVLALGLLTLSGAVGLVGQQGPRIALFVSTINNLPGTLTFPPHVEPHRPVSPTHGNARSIIGAMNWTARSSHP